MAENWRKTMAFKISKESERKGHVEQQKELVQIKARNTERLIAKYLEEEDRDFAYDVWGTMLQERGIDLTTISKGGKR
jgi:hypothetical protein